MSRKPEIVSYSFPLLLGYYCQNYLSEHIMEILSFVLSRVLFAVTVILGEEKKVGLPHRVFENKDTFLKWFDFLNTPYICGKCTFKVFFFTSLYVENRLNQETAKRFLRYSLAF